jgi:hypothetical protein
MASTRVLFPLIGLATACALAVASGGARWGAAQVWLWLSLIAGLALAAGILLGRPPASLSTLPRTSAELIDWLAAELGGSVAAQHAHRFASFRALAHALYGEHDQAMDVVDDARWEGPPAVRVVREQTLAALAYLRGDAERGLAHATAAQRIVHTVTQPFPERAEQLARFYVAWGEVLTARFQGPTLAAFERFCTDPNPILGALARAALARAAVLLGRDREALEARVQLAELAPAALGVRDHADPAPGYRSSIRIKAVSASALRRATRRAARR